MARSRHIREVRALDHSGCGQCRLDVLVKLEETRVIKDNWRPVLLALLGVNLLFMILLEQQRRFFSQQEREYFIEIRRLITETDKTKENYEYIARLLEDIKSRANNVETAVQEAPRVAATIADIRTRVNSVQAAIQGLEETVPISKDTN